MTIMPKPGDLHDAAVPDLDAVTGSGVSADPVTDYLKRIRKIPVLTAEQEVDLSKRIEAGLFAEHKLKTNTRLSGVLRQELEVIAADGARARALMVESNLRLVVSVAKKYAARGAGTLHFPDVIQEGNLGLIHAVEKFDYTKGYKFSTYAVWWIRQAITRGLADGARTIRVPVRMLETLGKLWRVESELEQLLGSDLTDDDIAAAMGITTEKLDELRLIDLLPVSIDAAVGDDDDSASLESFLQDVLGTRPEDAAILRDQVARILAALDHNFTEREAAIIRLRLGLYDGQCWETARIAAHFGVTKERIRQLLRRTLKRLRVILGVPARAAS